MSDDEEGKEEEEEERMVLEEMFERMNECATLNPDTDEDEENDENDENDDPMFFGADGMVTAETLSFLGEGRGGYFTSEKAIREAGFGEKLDEFERKLVINEEDRKRFEDAEE